MRYSTFRNHGENSGCRGKSLNASNATVAEKGTEMDLEMDISFRGSMSVVKVVLVALVAELGFDASGGRSVLARTAVCDEFSGRSWGLKKASS